MNGTDGDERTMSDLTKRLAHERRHHLRAIDRGLAD